MTYATFDLETGIQRRFKRKATPFYNTNEIIAFGSKHKGEARPAGIYFPEQKADNWFVDLLRNVRLLVGFNIKFDILHAICQSKKNYEAWQEFIAGGGQLWDCQLAEYLLHGMAQEQHTLSLDEVAPRYGGTLKNDAVKALWQAGVDTIDIDRDLLMEYLLGTGGDDLGDIGNTERVFLGQLSALRARGSVNSVMLNMGALVFTIEAEYNGMYVDKELGLALAQEVKAELDQLEVNLQTFLPADLPFEFKWTSRFHLSALIFGGDVNYKARTVVREDGKAVFFQKDEEHVVMLDGTTKALADMVEYDWTQCARFAGGKNKGAPKTKKVKVPDIERGPKTRIEDFVYTFPRITEPAKAWESSTPGVYSVSSDVIKALGDRDIPFLKALAQRAALAKDLGTYYITTDEDTGEQKGMLTLVGPDGLIHHSLHMTRTVTARLSSSDPNLQNVSGGKKSKVKSVFVSRFDSGYVVQSDFTSLEIYGQAVLTGCVQLILDLKSGLDMHCSRAHEAWGKPLGLTYEQVYQLAVVEEDDVWSYRRKNAKVFSFQRAYGAGAAKIAETTGMTVEEVEELIAAEAVRYPEIDAFYEQLTATIKENRVPTQRYLQHPEIPGMTCQLGRSYYFTPDGKMYSYSEHPAPKFVAERPASRGGTPQSFSPTEIRNYVVQGLGGEWAKAAMWLAVRAFYARKNFGGLALLVNQVHDALYADAEESVVNEASALLEACMLEASTLMEYHFRWTLPIGVPTATRYGRSMMEENRLPDGHDDRVALYREQVRRDLCGNHTPSFEKE